MSRSVFNRSRRGIVSIEFGLIGAAFFLLLFACIDVGRYVASRTALRAAVSEAVRGVMTDPSLAVGDAAKNYALARTAILNGAYLTLTASRVEPTASTAGSVTVNASYVFTFVVPGFPREPMTLNANVTSPI
ncbi:TadE/TadG family type IV pilus assembly protein [Falsiroseomonas sp.]|uniref:TadE/TadG family type IV pilus assembly protein n=1 Tax=Falsiroseomonas sp. TaxID=2870721 RepID=UPI00356AC73A